jgi:adenylate kinase family enzyme
MKIQIIGYSGSGKSTLAKRLAEHYNLPLLYLDKVQFYGNWQQRSNEEQERIVNEFLDSNESWVIDGNYSRICERRFREATTTIFLNFNRFFCFKEAFKRYKKYKNSIRESCGSPEKFDFEFILWLLWRGRTRKRRKMLYNNLNKCSKEKLIFKSRKKLNEYLRAKNIN